MELKWREKTFRFNNKELPAFRDGSGPRSRPNIDAPAYGFDTESSAIYDDPPETPIGERKQFNRYEVICFQVAGPVNPAFIRYLPERAKALEIFLMELIERERGILMDSRKAFIYCHNLIYDWNQLIKYYPELVAIVKTGMGIGSTFEIFQNNYMKVSIAGDGLFTGNAPHFDLYIDIPDGTTKTGRDKRIRITLMFRDTFSFFPSSLDKITKTLGLTPKRPRPKWIGKADYRIMPEECPRRKDFELYAITDAIATRETAEKIRQFHINAGMRKIRISAPGYAITKLFHFMPEGMSLYAGTNDETAMQMIVDSYAGGRTGGVYHGPVKNITVLDFHSSYPASMLTIPSFSDTMDYFEHPSPEALTVEELLELADEFHLFAEISGEETDAKYPALIQSKKGKLYPVYGEFENVRTSGVELTVGVRSGSLRIDKISRVIILMENEDDPYLPFKEFILDAYGRKEAAEKDSPEYLSAKLEMNSSYGKLIESHAENYVDLETRDYIVPFVRGYESVYGNMYYEQYLQSLRDPGGPTFDDRIAELTEYITTLEEVEYADFAYLSLTNKEYGHYAIPAAAALITATSRARLVTAMKATQALYWDTDSIFLKNYDEKKISAQLAAASNWLPAFIQPVTIGDRLGELGIEIANADGYLAGTKRYYLETARIYPDADHPGELVSKVKKALHGIPSAPYELAAEMIEALATGRNYHYKGKERPLTAKDAKRPEEIGRFVAEEIESKFELDPRLSWRKSGRGWLGSIKPFKNF